MRFFELRKFFIQVTTLQIQDAIIQRVNRLFFCFAVNPTVEFFQPGDSPAYNKIILTLNLFSPDLFSFYIGKTNTFSHSINYSDLLTD